MLNVVRLSYFIYSYAECHYGECRYAECHYDEGHYVESRGAPKNISILKILFELSIKDEILKKWAAFHASKNRSYKNPVYHRFGI